MNICAGKVDSYPTPTDSGLREINELIKKVAHRPAPYLMAEPLCPTSLI